MALRNGFGIVNVKWPWVCQCVKNKLELSCVAYKFGSNYVAVQDLWKTLLFNLYLIPTFTFNLFLYNTIVILIHCQFEKGGSRNKFVINVITNQNFSFPCASKRSTTSTSSMYSQVDLGQVV